MDEKELSRHYETLELEPGADLRAVRNAYYYLKDLYSQDSYDTVPVQEEFLDKKRGSIVKEIEEAYQALVNYLVPGGGGQAPDDSTTFLQVEIFDGKALREIRESQKINLREVSLATHISLEFLKYIEAEHFSGLPPEVYLKGYLKTYAEYLHVDSERVVTEYMARYDAWTREGEQ